MNVEGILRSLDIEYFQSGDRYMVQCPFHDDSNPSCGIWITSGYFQCFSGRCGANGSFAEFVAESEGIPIWEARRKVKGQDNISDLEDSIGRFLDRDEKELKFFKWSSFSKTFPAVIPETQGWDYLIGRKLTAESIVRFRIRWGGDVGKYRYRVILPIRTVEGKLLAYAGRTIKKAAVPKTRKNRSPHSVFYGLYELLQKYGKVPLLMLVEGEFDAIYLQQFGIPAISNMGTMPLNPVKILLLRRYCKRVVLNYDGDEAGEIAMVGDEKKKGALELLAKYIPVSILRLPEGSDPNSLSEEEVMEIYGEYSS